MFGQACLIPVEPGGGKVDEIVTRESQVQVVAIVEVLNLAVDRRAQLNPPVANLVVGIEEEEGIAGSPGGLRKVNREAAIEGCGSVPRHRHLDKVGWIDTGSRVDVHGQGTAARLHEISSQHRCLNILVAPRRQDAMVGELVAALYHGVVDEIDAPSGVEHPVIDERVHPVTKIDIAGRGQSAVIVNGFVAGGAHDVVRNARDGYVIVDDEAIGRAVHKPHSRAAAVDGAPVQCHRDRAGGTI